MVWLTYTAVVVVEVLAILSIYYDSLTPTGITTKSMIMFGFGVALGLFALYLAIVPVKDEPSITTEGTN
jgi:hypothetical protein